MTWLTPVTKYMSHFSPCDDVARPSLGFFWTKNNGMTLIGDSWPPTFVYGVSNTGQIVGQNSDGVTEGYGHATTWKNGVMTDLRTLSGYVDVADGYGSSANGVNDLGVVVGWSTIDPVPCCFITSSATHAIQWSSNGTMSDLGTLPGDTSSMALKVNRFGQIIGSSGNTLYYGNEGSSVSYVVVGRPFLWTKSGGMQDLNSLISTTSGWVLNTATDINVWGQIVGQGTRNGEPHGYLLTPR